MSSLVNEFYRFAALTEYKYCFHAMSSQESNELQTMDQMVTKSMTENNQNNADDIDIGSDYSHFIAVRIMTDGVH